MCVVITNSGNTIKLETVETSILLFQLVFQYADFDYIILDVYIHWFKKIIRPAIVEKQMGECVFSITGRIEGDIVRLIIIMDSMQLVFLFLARF